MLIVPVQFVLAIMNTMANDVCKLATKAPGK